MLLPSLLGLKADGLLPKDARIFCCAPNGFDSERSRNEGARRMQSDDRVASEHQPRSTSDVMVGLQHGLERFKISPPRPLPAGLDAASPQRRDFLKPSLALPGIVDHADQTPPHGLDAAELQNIAP